MGTVVRARRLTRGYLVFAAIGMAVYALVPTAARPLLYVIVTLSCLVPTALGVRWMPRSDRPGAYLLLSALSILGVGNVLLALDTTTDLRTGAVARGLVTLGHAVSLLAALYVVHRRGRNDVGGVLDCTVAGFALAGLVWTVLLQPRLTADGHGTPSQAALLIVMLSLAGILGALTRLELVSRTPIPALRLFMLAVACATIGNVGLPLTGVLNTALRPPWIDIVFMVSYVMLAVATVQPTMVVLLSAGPPIEDRLSRGRLLFLGAALGANPLVAGVQQLSGRPVDALILAAGTVAVVPLVMARIGWLAAQRSRAEHALVHQANHDNLTGLPNRAAFLCRLDEAMTDAAHAPSVLFCDLNGFKAVNDQFGHLAGDELLRQVATRLSGSVRPADVVARYGGDEFVVLCPPPADPAAICQRIAQAFRHPFPIGGELVRVGVSIGAVVDTAGLDADRIVQRADQAMYAAKRQHDSSTAVALQIA